MSTSNGSAAEQKLGLSIGDNDLDVTTSESKGKAQAFALRIIDAFDLSVRQRALLQPWEYLTTRNGFTHRLPRFFYEVPSWEVARSTRISEHFDLWEFMDVDLHEDRELSAWPRHVPCAVTVLAAQLELLRNEVRTYIHISANGGYRTPAHKLSTHGSTHCWGTAVNIHRIGDDLLDDAKSIENYATIARRAMPGVFIRPFGGSLGEANDHLHIDLGYAEIIPHNVSEAFEVKEESDEA